MECYTCNAAIPEFADICPKCGKHVQVDTVRFDYLKNIFSARYNFLGLLGIGGFAEVYLAQDKLLEREVAIKILLPQHSQDPQTVERFLREARLYAKLEHANIIPIYDTGILEQHVFITMKYIRGESLKHVLFTHKRIAPELLPGIIRGVAQALSYIHQQGIVHRDIKPANIIVEKVSQAVYLADFGIARTESSQTLTQTGIIIGTPFYLSPEQIKGKKTDQRSDIYALGATLYELVTGKPPFQGDSPLEILYQHVNENAKSLEKTVPNIDPIVESIIFTCIEKDPARRFQKAEEILAMLEQAEGFQVNIPEKTVLTSTVRSQPGKIKKILAGMALLAILASAAYLLWIKDTPQTAMPSGKSTTVPVGYMAKETKKTVAAFSKKQPDASGKQTGERPAQKSGISAADRNAKIQDKREAPAVKQMENAKTTLAKSRKVPDIPAAPGTVQFSSFPPMADVYREGEKLGNTEQMFEKKLQPGNYLFVFSIPSYQSAEVPVSVSAGETVSAHHRFPPFRRFTITARPFGRIVIDGREYGDTPQIVKLAYGEHVIRVSKGGYRSEESKITISQDSKNSIFFELIKEDKR